MAKRKPATADRDESDSRYVYTNTHCIMLHCVCVCCVCMKLRPEDQGALPGAGSSGGEEEGTVGRDALKSDALRHPRGGSRPGVSVCSHVHLMLCVHIVCRARFANIEETEQARQGQLKSSTYVKTHISALNQSCVLHTHTQETRRNVHQKLHSS